TLGNRRGDIESQAPRQRLGDDRSGQHMRRPLNRAMSRLGGVAMTKGALRLLGVETGEPRLPQLMPTGDQLDELAVDLRAAGVIA
ncbi:hypothetical protein ACFXG3_31025, partial [Nocardia tengchongensis]